MFESRAAQIRFVFQTEIQQLLTCLFPSSEITGMTTVASASEVLFATFARKPPIANRTSHFETCLIASSSSS